MTNKPSFLENVVGMFRDRGTPTRDKVMMIAGAVYIFSPIDLLPDLVPLLGYTDDLGVLIGTVGLFIRSYRRYVRNRDVVAVQSLKRWE
jgi:uncharacterized membrane protein YkvA (DUF1232 family)